MRTTIDTMPDAMSNVTLAVIAGGRGVRMGMPKALLSIDGRSMPAWLLDRIQWQGPTLLVTAPSIPQLPDAGRFTRQAVDPVDDVGPLRGVLSALESATTDLLVTIAVDMPNVTAHQLAWLVAKFLESPDRLGLMCRVGSYGNDGDARVEPFPAAYRRDARAVVERRLLAGRRSVRGLCLDDERFATVSTPGDWPSDAWANLNDRAALDRFLTSPYREYRT